LNSISKGNNTIGDHVIVGVAAMLISNVPDDNIVAWSQQNQLNKGKNQI
jgi:hypothetical protein